MWNGQYVEACQRDGRWKFTADQHARGRQRHQNGVEALRVKAEDCSAGPGLVERQPDKVGKNEDWMFDIDDVPI